MKERLNWKSIESKVSLAIRNVYKSYTNYVSSQVISEEIVSKKLFLDASYRATMIRVTTTLQKRWGFEIYSSKSTGPVFVVPDKWWDKRRRFIST